MAYIQDIFQQCLAVIGVMTIGNDRNQAEKRAAFKVLCDLVPFRISPLIRHDAAPAARPRTARRAAGSDGGS